jgi:hypothetical protein
MDWNSKKTTHELYCPDQRRKIFSFRPNTKLGAQKVGNKLEKDRKKTTQPAYCRDQRRENSYFNTQYRKLGARIAANKPWKTAAIYNILSQLMSLVFRSQTAKLLKSYEEQKARRG